MIKHLLLTFLLLVSAAPLAATSVKPVESTHIEVIGMLQETQPTMGGSDFDSCLGSPYFYLQDPSVQASPKAGVTKLRFVEVSAESAQQRASLLGKRVRVKAIPIDKTVDANAHWAPKSEADKNSARPVFSGLNGAPAMIHCKYLEVLTISEEKDTAK